MTASEDSGNFPEYPPHSIAIVGMAGRFPEADSVDELWDLLLEGKSTVIRAPVERLQLPQRGNHATTKWWGNFLRDPERFDHRFFKKSSREAIAWDPQQRILLEVLYEALESAGHFGPSSDVETDDYGCYIGAVMNNYYDNLTCYPTTAYATLGSSRPFLSGVMSHHFGWTGPSLTIDTACSSSLVAVNTACRAIWSGECTRAIAGGTNVISSPFDYQNLHAAGLLSPTGQCKPFDVDADGYCRGEGVAVVILKPLFDAIQDHSNILGVIIGSAVNQNQNFSHITVPHSGSQVNLYQKAMKLGNVKPESISYVEAHGTGTGVGDPVEARSIRDAFGGPQRDSPLYFASIKGNIGHTEATAGVSGLVKVLLMLKHGKIPRQASYKGLNPKIPSLDQDQMVIPTSTLPWNPPVRLAFVNSHGAAGSNSTLLLREKPLSNTMAPPVHLSKYPLFISAGSARSLSMHSGKLLVWLRKAEAGVNSELATLTFNLADRANHSLSHVLSAPVSDIQDLEMKLDAASRGIDIVAAKSSKPLIFVFGGQESDYIGLSKEVYQTSDIFRKHLDECDQALIGKGLGSLYPAIFGRKSIENLMTLHSALFAVQYASAKAWIDCGLKVDAVVGHSFGQLTAYCISGSLSLLDALTLVVERASLMQKYWGPERGSMISLQADRKTVDQILASLRNQEADFYAEIACYNGSQNHVIVGSFHAIELIEQHVTETPYLRNRVPSKRLQVTHGFHSRFTEPLLPRLTAIGKSLDWLTPTLHLEACTEVGNGAKPDFRIVSEHTRAPVFFQKAITRLAMGFSQCTWIEVGRGSSVIQLVKSSVPDSRGHTFLSPQLASSNGSDSLVETTIQLWKHGHNVQFWPFHRSQKPRYEHLSFPSYPFEKTKHWLPFIGGESRKDSASKDVRETQELISFLHFKGESEQEAIFQIDPASPRFQAIVEGHVMASQALVPASLYFEVVTLAALHIAKDTEAKIYVPTIDDLQMKYPAGCDMTVEILLTLTRLNGSSLSWSFSITTKVGTLPGSKLLKHCTGSVYLKKRNDLQSAREFKRFESLAGDRRYKAVFNHDDAEKMQGGHIYRAFSTAVQYGEIFHGIKKIACVEHEAAGTVMLVPDTTAPAAQRLCHAPMVDSFMQFAGFLVNYFNNPSLKDILICGGIEHIEMGGNFTPDAKEWIVYATMNEGIVFDASADVYVFEAESKRMVMTIFGCGFSKMPQTLLARILGNVNQSGPPNSKLPNPHLYHQDTTEDMKASVRDTPTSVTQILCSKKPELLQILSNITDIPLSEIRDDSTLEDLGIDSLMATEVLNDIRKILGVTLDLTSFLFFPHMQALVAHVDEMLATSSTEASACDIPLSTNRDYDASDLSMGRLRESRIPAPEVPKIIPKPTINSAVSAFEETRHDFDQLADGTKATDFWSRAYPYQARLVLAYVVEAFAKLGCDIASFRSGERVPQVKALKKHAQLIHQLYRVLEDGKLIESSNEGFVRTNACLDGTPAESIYQQVIGLQPQHDDVNNMIRAVGSQIAACLAGDVDGLEIVFGSKETKRTLEAVYEFWPLLRTCTILLGNFLTKAFTNATGKGKYRILEVGAGTGGTTRYIVEHLKSQGVPFEYVFTDISASLVGAARKKFKDIDGMTFEILDIEKPVKPEYEGAFHCIIATNCIHATRSLEGSLTHLHKMLREDGVLTLIEITKNMFWLDIVVGLLEGWWLFEDGRSHALVDESHWKRVLKKAGFNEVLWSDGMTLESKTVRVISAFPQRRELVPIDGTSQSKKPVNATVETVVYKRVEDLEIHADIYYPDEGGFANEKKIPIALMIHGGSHIIFSRKDIRPAQTRLLLDMGFLPVSLDHRLCPEVSLADGPMVDVCDALHWARNTLPNMGNSRQGLQIDGDKVVVVGWSSGGQLAMSLGWTAPQRGLQPPEAILAFYCPTNYEDEWWRHPIQPIGAEDKGYNYDILDSVRDTPITNYAQVGAWEPLSDPRILTDDRSRIVLHINWKAQTLPVILNGLPSKGRAGQYPHIQDWNALEQPSIDKAVAASAYAQICRGNFRTPTFLIHGTADDLIPWQQSQSTYKAMLDRDITAELVLVEGAPHICDLSSDPDSQGWKAVVQGYKFLSLYAFT